MLGGSAIETAMRQLIPAFERRTGADTVTHDFDGAIGQMTARIRNGERADVVIVSRPQVNELIKHGSIMPRSDADLAKVAIGVFVRTGAPKPDISSVESFKRAMLAASSIGWNDLVAGAPVSLYMIGLFERLGIATEMQPKSVAFSEIIAASGVELVGALPDEIQNHTLFAAGIGTHARDPQASKALIEFLSSKEAEGVWTANGFRTP